MIGIEKAMILAAGYGSRLLPITENIPKALVAVKGKPMIKNVVDKLISFGIKEIVVNVHHHADKIIKYFNDNQFEAKIITIAEEDILGTGGGIKNAKTLLDSTANFLVYNADVSSEIDLDALAYAHLKNECLATIAVNQRITSRPLLFNSGNILIGRKVSGENFIFSDPGGEIIEKAFCGIHILSSEIFKTFPDESFFDITDHYMELVKNGYTIKAFDIGSTYWKDLGKISDLV